MRCSALAVHVADGHFADGRAIPRRKRRNEAVQLTVERHLLENLAAIGFEGRAEVVNIDTAQLSHQPICYARRDAPHPEIVDANLAPAADNVITGSNFFEEHRDVGGIVLQIAIHGDDVFAARMVETSGQTGRLAKVTAKLDHGHAAVDGCDLAQHSERVVIRAVIDQHNFERLTGSLHYRFQAVVEIGYVLLLVVQGDDDRVLGHRTFIIA